MQRWLMLLSGLASILAADSRAVAAPIRTLAGLQSVTIYEITFGTTANTYAPNAAQLITRLADPLSAANTDFSFFANEYYDVFYSNADGAPNLDGEFLSIEGVWRSTSTSGGMNINEVQLGYTGGATDFGDFVSSFVVGSVCNPALAAHCIPGSELLAVDHNLGTFPRFGNTSITNLNERFRLTIGFDGISVPEPAAGALLAAAVGAIAVRGRRRRA